MGAASSLFRAARRIDASAPRLPAGRSLGKLDARGVAAPCFILVEPKKLFGH